MRPLFLEKFRLHRQVGESYILSHDTNSSVLVRVNRVAAEILELCNGANSVDEISETLAEKYFEDIKKTKYLVLNFLSESHAKGHVCTGYELIRQLDRKEAVTYPLVDELPTIYQGGEDDRCKKDSTKEAKHVRACRRT